jgi:octaprenyl-diphosphate synthase
MCAKFEPEVLRFITSVTASICEGELRQTIHRKNYNLSEEEYLQIITDKSASLFESCCFLGAFLAGADEKEKKALADFGLNFGIAFQLADDLVDIIGDENKSEKTLGSDVSKNKPTLALICLLRRLSRSEKKKLILKLNNDKIDTKALRKMIESKGSANYVRSQIALFTDRAVVKLRPLKDSIAKKALIETAKFINRLTA